MWYDLLMPTPCRLKIAFKSFPTTQLDRHYEDRVGFPSDSSGYYFPEDERDLEWEFSSLKDAREAKRRLRDMKNSLSRLEIV